MTSIAERVCQEIVKQQMFQVYSDTKDAQFTVTFKPNAVEQLEALISDEIALRAEAWLREQKEAK